MKDSSEQLESELRGRQYGRLIAITIIMVLLFGGLIWFGVWLFRGGPLMAKAIPPEVVVKGWYDALAENRPQVLWDAQPLGLKQDFTDRIKRMGAAAVEKPRLYQRGMGVARNFAQLVHTKKGVFVGLLNYKPKEVNPVAQLGDLQSAVGSLLDDNAPALGLKIPDAGEVIGNVANAQIAAMMKQYKIEPWKFDATAGILFTLLDSDIKDINWLQNPNLSNFINKTGGALMSQLDAIPAQEGEDSWGKGFKDPLKGIVVKPVSQEGNAATVEVHYPPMAFLGTRAEVKTLQLVHVDREWRLAQPDLIFGAMQAGIAGVDAKVKAMESYQVVGNQLLGIEGADEESAIQGLDEVDKLIDEINLNVRTTDDFVALLRKKFLGPLEGALSGGLDALGGGEAPKPKPAQPVAGPNNGQPLGGVIPGRPAGSTNSVAQPSGLANPNAAQGIWRNKLWLVGYNEASRKMETGEIGYSIERTFVGQGQDSLLQAFGKPAGMQNGKIFYRGLRVYHVQNRIALQTVVFNIVNRRIAAVTCY